MSSENEDTKLSLQSLLGSSAPDSDQKKPRIRYTRDFFLSLSGLDVCKNLPSGLDKSVLSDLEDSANIVFERQRIVGNLSSHGPRWVEHGSQSLSKLENSNIRGNSARWDTRSSVLNSREGDLQPDRDSFTQDSGRKYGNQNRRTWQHQEHDGLLGSGALARPSGYTGASSSKARGNVQLCKTTEPYQPPRPYKAVTFSRKDGTDSCNDETFGSSECSDKDRSEEERKRRESFELMRKGQHKTLQENQHKDIIKGNLDEDMAAESLRKGQHKPFHEKQKDIITGNFDKDLVALIENGGSDKSAQSKSKPDESATDSLLNDSFKPFSHVHIPASRPLVPPGFASTTEKTQQISKLKNLELQFSDEKENSSAPSSTDVNFGNISFTSSGLQKGNEIWEEDIPSDSFHKKEAGPDRVDTVSQKHSTSMFNKLFGNTLVKDFKSLASDTQKHVSEADEEGWSHVASVSSKFSHLFHEENEEKSTQDKSSRDLLSLIVNKDNFFPQAYMSSNDEATEQNRSILPSENNIILSSASPSPITGMQSYQSEKQGPSCDVLTCEDLEQSILADVEDRCSTMQSLKEPWITVDTKSEEHSDVVDDHASQHLLSLLQIGANSKESTEPPRVDAIGIHETFPASYVESSLCLQNNDSAALNLSETEHNSEKCITLETLFGSAFMNELHSMEAPVSAQKTTVGKVTNEGSNQLPFYPLDRLNLLSNEQPSKKDVLEGEILQPSSDTERTRAYKNSGNWEGFKDSLHGFKLGDVTFEQAAGDIHLPEEDSLISLSDSLDNLTYESLHFQNSNINESLGPKKATGDLSDKLHAILRVGELSRESPVDYPPLMHNSHEMVDPDGLYHHLQVRPSSQFPHQMNNGMPLFASHMDHSTFRNSQMNFCSPDAFHRDLRHPFSSNAFPHHSYNNFSGQHLDPANHHPMLQAMPHPGNIPSHNTVQGFPQRMNHVPEFSHELNHPHLLSLRHRQANYGGLDMGIPGAVGRPSLEMYERLIEMEMRANPKFRPAMSRPVSGMYGTEFDMNLHYR